MKTALTLIALSSVSVVGLGCDRGDANGTSATSTVATAAASSAPSAVKSAPPAATTAAASASASSVASAGGAPSAASGGAAMPTSDVFDTSKGEVRVTPIHHATLMFQFGGKNYYVDPITEGGVLEGRPAADVIFITDIHPDHLDAPAIDKLKKQGTVIVAPPAVAAQYPGVTVVMKNGETRDVAGVSVEAVPMYNLTRGPSAGKLFHDKGRGDGYVLGFGDRRFYLSGDTECTDEMRALKHIDVAFVCMNLPYTMPPSEAAACVRAFQPKVVFPYHFRDSNLTEFTSAIPADSGIEVRVRKWY